VIKKKEAGQALILVLILLAIGALMVVPSLGLVDTSLQSHKIVASQQRGFYVAEAAQQKVQWMLLRSNLTDNLSSDGDTVHLTVDVCDYVADVTVVMRAMENKQGVILAQDDTIMPTMTVSPNIIEPPSGLPMYFDYEIILTQVSCNNTSDLAGIWVILPTDFGHADEIFVSGSSEISIDGGEWQQIGDPFQVDISNPRFQWTGPGDNFPSDFTHFEPAQVNRLRFQILSKIQGSGMVLCCWVVIKVGDIYTISGCQAPLNVGNVPVLNVCETDGQFNVYKTADPAIIPPLVSTEITYSIKIYNMDGNTRAFNFIEDFLPPGFEYVGPTSGFPEEVEEPEPYSETVTLNGVERQRIWWNEDQLTSSGLPIGGGESMTFSFVARSFQLISGTYYNEVIVAPASAPTPPSVITDIDDFFDWDTHYTYSYSWNSGTVIIPAYDSEAKVDGEIIDANYALEPGGVTVNSWHVR